MTAKFLSSLKKLIKKLKVNKAWPSKSLNNNSHCHTILRPQNNNSCA